MSMDYAVFFNYDGALEDVAVWAENLYKHKSVKKIHSEYGERYFLDALGVCSVLLIAEDFEDDENLQLTPYNYYFSFWASNMYVGDPVFEAFYDSMVKFIASQLAETFKVKVLVCRNMQTEIARYNKSSAEIQMDSNNNSVD